MHEPHVPQQSQDTMLSGHPVPLGSQEPFTMMPTSPVAYNSLGAVIGIAVLGSLVVALLALFIGYRHWQKGKAHQHLVVAYSGGRLDSSEYVMPGERCSCKMGGGAWRGEKRGRIGRLLMCWDRAALPGRASLRPARSPRACVCSRRCAPQLQPLLLQPQLPHPVTVLPEPPAPEQGQCWGSGGAAEGWAQPWLSGKLHPGVLLSHSTPPPPIRFQAVSCSPASKPQSGQGARMGSRTTAPCLLTGSTAGSPRQGLRTGVGAWRPRPLRGCGRVQPGVLLHLSVGGSGSRAAGSPTSHWPLLFLLLRERPPGQKLQPQLQQPRRPRPVL